MRKIIQICTLLIMTVLLFSACTGNASSSANTDHPTTDVTQQATETPSAATESVSADPPLTPAAEQSRLIRTKLDSVNLQNNQTGASTEKTLVVYLPPSYYEETKAYPVVYYLHGHGESVGGLTGASRVKFDKAFESGANEFIVVEIQGDKSYYVNSPVAGNWEDYIIDEVIPLIDSTYRTIADKDSRGICGFSMGGFGSMNLALRHTDVFSAVYSMSPGLLKDEDFAEAMAQWKSDSSFLTDYARAFAPDAAVEKKLGHIPVLDGSDEDNAIIELWKTGFGNIEEKIDAYLAQGTPLKAIGLSYGTNDSYKWIPKGTQYFSDYLTQKGVEHTLFVFDGNHVLPPNAAEEHLIPFFDDNLKF